MTLCVFFGSAYVRSGPTFSSSSPSASRTSSKWRFFQLRRLMRPKLPLPFLNRFPDRATKFGTPSTFRTGTKAAFGGAASAGAAAPSSSSSSSTRENMDAADPARNGRPAPEPDAPPA